MAKELIVYRDHRDAYIGDSAACVSSYESRKARPRFPTVP